LQPIRRGFYLIALVIGKLGKGQGTQNMSNLLKTIENSINWTSSVIDSIVLNDLTQDCLDRSRTQSKTVGIMGWLQPK